MQPPIIDAVPSVPLAVIPSVQQQDEWVKFRNDTTDKIEYLMRYRQMNESNIDIIVSNAKVLRESHLGLVDHINKSIAAPLRRDIVKIDKIEADIGKPVVDLAELEKMRQKIDNMEKHQHDKQNGNIFFTFIKDMITFPFWIVWKLLKTLRIL